MFDDREAAGRELAALLAERGVAPDVVLAVPRGGLPVGRMVADRFDVPLDVVAAKKLGAPGNPELAIGAAASDGTVWVNDDLVARLGVDSDYLAAERERAAETAREKVDAYRADRPPLDLVGLTVAVVDDGVATGATTRACIESVRAMGAARVVLGVPVGPQDTLDELAGVADSVVCVETPGWFGAVGQAYRDFSQVSDADAMAYLDDGE
ncbi:phosphoribosyltransferase [Halobacterium litoreum]|uniref:Phosphoribosyltransferase n=1 Tax=Halobacterium litoreum TaxID=2039234 RepID=A0ABD5NBH1_9EURY|nr:phosphoribosyltransferase family protein [Halobacterium litoreum]UHH14466.1 phosphoribosyltransferase [Halobacterium litoreum]